MLEAASDINGLFLSAWISTRFICSTSAAGWCWRWPCACVSERGEMCTGYVLYLPLHVCLYTSPSLLSHRFPRVSPWPTAYNWNRFLQWRISSQQSLRFMTTISQVCIQWLVLLAEFHWTSVSSWLPVPLSLSGDAFETAYIPPCPWLCFLSGYRMNKKNFI